jgi:multidrug transporter EmrE-like cation transporter
MPERLMPIDMFLMVLGAALVHATWNALALSGGGHGAVHGLHAVLNRAYQMVDLSLVYPLARGAAPFIVAVVSVWFLGDQLSQTGVLAILLIGLGITSLTCQRP